MNEFLIQSVALTKNFGSFKAVDNINLNVPKGGIYGFLGPNGAGKSTTIRMLLGLIKPSEGNVFLFNKPLKSHRLEILKKVGSLVESPSYYGHLTAYENLEITRKLLEVEKSAIDDVLHLVKLHEVKNKAVKKFSLGMKQRLGIAQALLGSPELLILDEPTNGLDPAGIHEIRDLIKRLPNELGITVLISSHILSEIELVASHLGIINGGKLIYQGTLEELREKSTDHIEIYTNANERAANFLQKQGFKAGINKGYLLIKDRNAEPSVINKELVMNGFSVSHLIQQRETLEEIFLKMTGQEG